MPVIGVFMCMRVFADKVCIRSMDFLTGINGLLVGMRRGRRWQSERAYE